jgi:hypothetical protein
MHGSDRAASRAHHVIAGIDQNGGAMLVMRIVTTTTKSRGRRGESG